MVKYLSEFIVLAGIYIAAGRKGAVPIGIALFGSWQIVFLYILIIELAQVPLFYFLLGSLASRMMWVQRLKKKYQPQRHKIMHSKLFLSAKRNGGWGVFFIVAMPAFTGGVLGGVVLARLLGIKPRQSIPAILAGILVCDAGLIMSVEGIKWLFD
ncbi:MAG: small multi-drug export protein [bacterium]|nr:small multi-drug export protein [bacterium]MDD5755647.1 small multi-drug export protein [bacterium]